MRRGDVDESVNWSAGTSHQSWQGETTSHTPHHKSVQSYSNANNDVLKSTRFAALRFINMPALELLCGASTLPFYVRCNSGTNDVSWTWLTLRLTSNLANVSAHVFIMTSNVIYRSHTFVHTNNN